MAFLATQPGRDRLIASVATQGLWESTDGGDSWNALGQGKDSEMITNRASSITFDPDDATTFWESGIYHANGIYRTNDDGDTFKSLSNIWHNDYVSIDFTDPKRRTLLASGHEQAHTLYQSTDGGENWTTIGDSIPQASSVCPFPVVLDAQTYLLGCDSQGGAQIGIYRSTDAGTSWMLVADRGGGSAPLFASDGSIYWATENKAGIVRSTDQGETWSDPAGVGVVAGTHPVELPDGRLATLGAQQVVVSADQGQSWTVVSPAFPFDPNGLVYSPEEKAFYIWHFSCGGGNVPVPDDAILRYDYDYEAQ
jgi:photosystem II stability/assembly factor-like uncharacterized protein